MGRIVRRALLFIGLTAASTGWMVLPYLSVSG